MLYTSFIMLVNMPENKHVNVHENIGVNMHGSFKSTSTHFTLGTFWLVGINLNKIILITNILMTSLETKPSSI